MRIEERPALDVHDLPRARRLWMLEFGSRTEFDDPSLEYRRLFSELLETFMLVLVAAGGGILHAKGQISLASAVVAPGLLVQAIILFMGAVSGAHVNPVVSLAFAVTSMNPARSFGPSAGERRLDGLLGVCRRPADRRDDRRRVRRHPSRPRRRSDLPGRRLRVTPWGRGHRAAGARVDESTRKLVAGAARRGGTRWRPVPCERHASNARLLTNARLPGVWLEYCLGLPGCLLDAQGREVEAVHAIHLAPHAPRTTRGWMGCRMRSTARHRGPGPRPAGRR